MASDIRPLSTTSQVCTMPMANAAGNARSCMSRSSLQAAPPLSRASASSTVDSFALNVADWLSRPPSAPAAAAAVGSAMVWSLPLFEPLSAPATLSPFAAALALMRSLAALTLMRSLAAHACACACESVKQTQATRTIAAINSCTVSSWAPAVPEHTSSATRSASQSPTPTVSAAAKNVPRPSVRPAASLRARLRSRRARS
ncbi:hypothetical protein T492DRAFT_1027462 [Pavlovales sp. CCMP2436]|nr:hypothetical protein T492DRAFT_1027462 [Pavlovales sp. CCMP2436]